MAGSNTVVKRRADQHPGARLPHRRRTRKISKSSGVTVDPATLVGQYGTDAVRSWLLREVPRVGDADFTLDRLINRANDELANGLGTSSTAPAR
jgi:methionyl-tRNA synthetase